MFIKAGGRRAGQTLRGPVLARQDRETGPIQSGSKRSKERLENKPRHTLGGCWLAQPLGTPSSCNARQWDPASSSQESAPGWAGLSWLLGPTIASWGYKEWILTEFGAVQYFSRKMGILDQEGDFPVICALGLCGYILIYFRSGI